MKPQELRIGNWFNWDGNNPTQLTLGHFQDMLLYVDDSRKYQPIPLTEEWLEKFGFVWDGMWWWDKGGFGYSFVEGRCSHEVKKNVFCELPFYLYVHQIQNLYFALKGEEL